MDAFLETLRGFLDAKMCSAFDFDKLFNTGVRQILLSASDRIGGNIAAKNRQSLSFATTLGR